MREWKVRTNRSGEIVSSSGQLTGASIERTLVEKSALEAAQREIAWLEQFETMVGLTGKANSDLRIENARLTRELAEAQDKIEWWEKRHEKQGEDLTAANERYAIAETERLEWIDKCADLKRELGFERAKPKHSTANKWKEERDAALAERDLAVEVERTQTRSLKIALAEVERLKAEVAMHARIADEIAAEKLTLTAELEKAREGLGRIANWQTDHAIRGIARETLASLGR